MKRYDESRADKIEEVAAQAWAARRDLADRLREVVQEIVGREGRVTELERRAPRQPWPRGHERHVPTGEDQLIRTEERELVRLRERRERMQHDGAELDERVRTLGALRQACSDWLKGIELEGSPVVLRPAQPVKLKADVPGQLAELRSQIATLVDELADVRRRPLPQDEALVEFERSLAMEAAKCSTFEGVFTAPVNAEGPPRTIPLGLPDAGSTTTLVSVLALLFPDRLREIYRSRIEAFLAANPPGLPRTERKAKIAELETKLHEAEVQEEAVVRLAQARSLPVTRRGDARPAVVLAWSVEDVAPATPEAA